MSVMLRRSGRLRGVGVLSCAVGWLWWMGPAISVTGCAASPPLDEGDQREPGQTYRGRIASVSTWPLPSDVFESLTEQDRDSLTQAGVRLQESPPALISQELPLQGHWVRIGEAACMIDTDGSFTIDALPEGAMEVRVFRQLGDTDPEETFPLSILAPLDETPDTTVLSVQYTLPDSARMDGSPPQALLTARTKGGGAAPDGCALRGCSPIDKPTCCCLDYDNPNGDGLDRERSEDEPGVGAGCGLTARYNFLNSTCYDWVFNQPGQPCANEGAVNPGGPGCFRNHKYRYCQAMDINGFSLSATRADVDWGGRFELRVRNSTAANESLLRLEEDDAGTLELAVVADVNAHLEENRGAYLLRHYDDDLESHYDEVPLVYTAPQPSPGRTCQTTLHLVAEGGGHRRTLEIRVGHALQITPPSATVDVGGAAEFTVQVVRADGTVENALSSDYEWSVVPNNVAAVVNGTAVGAAPGTGLITAQSRQCDGRATATLVVRDESQGGGEDDPTGSSTAGDWIGLVAYQDFAKDGTWYALFLSMTDRNGTLSGSYSGSEIPQGTPLPTPQQLQAGPIRGQFSGTRSAGSIVITLSGDLQLTLRGDISGPEADDDPKFDLFFAGGFDDPEFPGLPFAVGGIDFGRLR